MQISIVDTLTSLLFGVTVFGSAAEMATISLTYGRVKLPIILYKQKIFPKGYRANKRWRVTYNIVCLFGEMTLRPCCSLIVLNGNCHRHLFFRNGIEINQVDSLLFDAPYGQL